MGRDDKNKPVKLGGPVRESAWRWTIWRVEPVLTFSPIHFLLLQCQYCCIRTRRCSRERAQACELRFSSKTGPGLLFDFQKVTYSASVSQLINNTGYLVHLSVCFFHCCTFCSPFPLLGEVEQDCPEVSWYLVYGR